MITGSGGLHARRVRRGALSRPSPGSDDDQAPDVVDGPRDRALVGRRQALWVDELADGTLSSSGAPT